MMTWKTLTKRPERSVLVQCADRAFRIDLFRQGNAFAVKRIYEPQKGASAEDNWLAPLLKGGPPAAREVVILSDSARLILSELPDAPPTSQLEEILTLEAEQMSGLSAVDTTIAHTILPPEDGMPRYLLCQLLWETVLTWRAQVKDLGARLTQVGHPGGFLIREGCCQLEHWRDTSILRNSQSGRNDLWLWNGDQAEAEAHDSLPWSAARDERVEVYAVESISNAAAKSSEGEASLIETLDLTTHDGRAQWAQGVARAFRPMDGVLGGVPLVAVPIPPVGRSQQVRIGVIAAVLAAALVYGHSQLIKHQRSQLQAELESLREPRQQLAELERERNTLRRELQNLRSTPKTDGGMNLFARGPHLEHLLAGLATAADPQSVVLSIEVSRGQLHLQGIALAPQAAQRLVDAINAKATGGWRAQLMRRKATLHQADGGPWDFLIVYAEGSPPNLTSMQNSPSTRRAAR